VQVDRRALLHALAWLLVVPPAAFLLARWLHLDEHSGRLFAFQALTFELLLPAWLGLALAALLRRWVLLGVALVVVVAHVALVLPDVVPDSQPDGGAPVVVLTSNAYVSNGAPDDYARAMVAVGADVVVVEELTSPVAAALDRAGLRETHPYRVVDRRLDRDSFASAIYSRWPLQAGAAVRIGPGRGVRARITVPAGGPVDVIAVHTIQPLADLAGLRDGLADLGRVASSRRGPMVLAGDFNSSRLHRPFAALLDRARLRDGHEVVGRGLARTWPANRRLPPTVLIDHVLVSEQIRVAGVQERTVPGTDHRAVVARLRLRRGSPVTPLP
jgi:endonuclease/exonuclease/phosphatase (EEP) superfamily protein YafD